MADRTIQEELAEFNSQAPAVLAKVEEMQKNLEIVRGRIHDDLQKAVHQAAFLFDDIAEAKRVGIGLNEETTRKLDRIQASFDGMHLSVDRFSDEWRQKTEQDLRAIGDSARVLFRGHLADELERVIHQFAQIQQEASATFSKVEKAQEQILQAAAKQRKEIDDYVAKANARLKEIPSSIDVNMDYGTRNAIDHLKKFGDPRNVFYLFVANIVMMLICCAVIAMK